MNAIATSQRQKFSSSADIKPSFRRATTVFPFQNRAVSTKPVAAIVRGRSWTSMDRKGA